MTEISYHLSQMFLVYNKC